MELGPILRAMSRNKGRFGLIVLEIALTLAVVVNCVAVILDARRDMARPSGFDDDNLIAVDSRPFGAAFREQGFLDASLTRDLQVLRSTPGVRAATNTNFLPWQGGGSSTELRALGPGGEMLRTQIYPADEATLETLGVPLIAGRTFTTQDVERDTRRLRALFESRREAGSDGRPREKFLQDVVMTRAYARLCFGEGGYLGKMLEDSDGDRYRVIGVIDGFYNPYGWPIHEYAVFYANRNRSFEAGARYLVRTEPGRTADVARALDPRLLASDAERNVQIRSLQEIRSSYFGPQRFVAWLMAVMAVLLVLVTSLGIGGLTSFSVTERTRQIGTRRALGATRADILRHFVLETWLLTGLGTALGIGLAVGLNLALVGVIAGAKLSGPVLLAGVACVWLVGLLATAAPARRGALISPALATRNI
jgi:putative ABC transport system permease protein